MKLFDLHCDTIERMEELGEDMLTDKTQLSLKYLPQMEKWCQTFAIFIPDSKRGADAVSYYERVLAYFHKMLQKARRHRRDGKHRRRHPPHHGGKSVQLCSRWRAALCWTASWRTSKLKRTASR